MNDRILDQTLDYLNEGIIYDELLDLLKEGMIYDTNNEKSKNKERITLHMDAMQTAAQGYILDPYIKICIGTGDKNTGVARISMKDCRVITHYANSKTTKDMKITNSLLDRLNEIINLPSNIKEFEGLTVYEAFYKDLQNRFIGQKISVYPIPDFRYTYKRIDKKTKYYYYTNSTVKEM